MIAVGGVMISYIKGQISYIMEDSIIIDNNGIGYQVFTSQVTLAKLNLNDSLTIFTYMNVRDDAITLFGFLSLEDLHMFSLLTTVSGVGSKSALSILDLKPAQEISFIILTEDTETLGKANGVGKKTAQRIVLELKDKVKVNDVYVQNDIYVRKDDDVSSFRQEATDALIALGYSKTESVRAVLAIDDTATDTESILKLALKNLSGR